MIARQVCVDICPFMACNISIVIHPANPFIPTANANLYYFGLYDKNGYLKDH
ncbi:coproporphyrinogen III oxidase [Chryseobacterium ginsenosidimutans]|jgi:coproporphyrinogen III oxidase|uniref:Coproporphyrinogen III oxidase n=1 Tax=Chryseobacterium geocarposphaerae TaxID=1416776 RepID=A0ABU1LBE5_9FLAO|nr:coproporphyrinogen III oxidase [Chryseobacterium geocarposphaerae]MDR6698433.1 coproporphyrinogen III oxidase [Chryseobacterium ginsenosidimutans]